MPGTLTFRPIEANLTRNTELIGKMNPYCSFSVGSTRFSTQVCKKGGKNPQWIDVVSIPIMGNEPTAVIEVFDKDKITKDDNIGSCTINLQQLIRDGSVSRWFPLFYGNTKSGDILLEASVTNGPYMGGSNSAYANTVGTAGTTGALGGVYGAQSTVLPGQQGSYANTQQTYTTQGPNLRQSQTGLSGNQQVVRESYETTTQESYPTVHGQSTAAYTQEALRTSQGAPNQQVYESQQLYQSQQALPTQQVTQQNYQTQQTAPLQQSYQYTTSSNQGALVGQSYADPRLDHATVPGQPGGYGQSAIYAHQPGGYANYGTQQQSLPIQPSLMNVLGLGGLGKLFHRSHKNDKRATNPQDYTHQSMSPAYNNQSLAGSQQYSNTSYNSTANTSYANTAYGTPGGYANNAYANNTYANTANLANTGYTTTTTNTATNVNNTAVPNPQLGAYYTGDQDHRYYVEQNEVVQPHTFTRPVQVTEVMPVQKQVEVYEARKVLKDVMYTQAVPVRRTIDVTEPYVVMKEVEVMEPRLVNKTIEVIENVPATRMVDVIEMRPHMQTVETFEPQTFHKQVAVTEQVPVHRNVTVSEPVTVTRAVEFVEPVITTETITKEIQAPVIVNERITQEVGPASLVGVRQDYQVTRDARLITGERQLSQGFNAMNINQGERRYEDEGQWEQKRLELSQRVFETHSNQGIMSRGRESFTTARQEAYVPTNTTTTNTTYTQQRTGDYRNY